MEQYSGAHEHESGKNPTDSSHSTMLNTESSTLTGYDPHFFKGHMSKKKVISLMCYLELSESLSSLDQPCHEVSMKLKNLLTALSNERHSSKKKRWGARHFILPING